MKHDHPTPDPTDPLADYTPVTLRARHDGWTAERQRNFLRALADTGCISEAAHATGITPRSAYRLRNHPQGVAFAAAWDQALQLAAARLMTTAYERAIKGGIRELWKDGKVVAEVRQPSDRLLIWLLDRMAPKGSAGAGLGYYGVMNWSRRAIADQDERLDALTDCDLPPSRSRRSTIRRLRSPTGANRYARPMTRMTTTMIMARTDSRVAV